MRPARGTVEARKGQVMEPLLTFDGVRIGHILEELTLYGATSVKMVRADRSGRESREINAPPGNAIFLRAPGFSAAPERPFHYMTDTKESRYVLGLRQPKP